MKKIAVLGAMALALSMFPATVPVLANSANDPLCSAEAPEGYKRPGGYCEQIDDTSSLVTTEKRDCVYKVIGFDALQRGEVVLVAEPQLPHYDECGNKIT